jgi:hypothetical protein
MRSNQDKDLYFFDESRFGTHSKIGHGWFRKGERTPVKVKLGFKNFYLYTCANPTTGNHFSYLMPKVNTQCFNFYLSELSKETNGREVILIVDQAGWHKSQDLILPSNITLVYLPPYCPELNPIERLWQYIKSYTIRNRIYDCLDILEDTICEFVNKLTPQEIASICKIEY